MCPASARMIPAVDAEVLPPACVACARGLACSLGLGFVCAGLGSAWLECAESAADHEDRRARRIRSYYAKKRRYYAKKQENHRLRRAIDADTIRITRIIRSNTKELRTILLAQPEMPRRTWSRGSSEAMRKEDKELMAAFKEYSAKLDEVKHFKKILKQMHRLYKVEKSREFFLQKVQREALIGTGREVIESDNPVIESVIESDPTKECPRVPPRLLCTEKKCLHCWH